MTSRPPVGGRAGWRAGGRQKIHPEKAFAAKKYGICRGLRVPEQHVALNKVARLLAPLATRCIPRGDEYSKVDRRVEGNHHEHCMMPVRPAAAPVVACPFVGGAIDDEYPILAVAIHVQIPCTTNLSTSDNIISFKKIKLRCAPMAHNIKRGVINNY